MTTTSCINTTNKRQNEQGVLSTYGFLWFTWRQYGLSSPCEPLDGCRFVHSRGDGLSSPCRGAYGLLGGNMAYPRSTSLWTYAASSIVGAMACPRPAVSAVSSPCRVPCRGSCPNTTNKRQNKLCNSKKIKWSNLLSICSLIQSTHPTHPTHLTHSTQ